MTQTIHETPLSILPSYGLTNSAIQVEGFGSGLINHTWKVVDQEHAYILQRVNHDVFKHPSDIAHNMTLLANYLQAHHPEYRFVAPLPSNDGEGLIYRHGNGYFRLFPFVKGSHSKDVVTTAREASEAAKQFGRFTHMLAGFNVEQLKITIPSFHDLILRYEQFLQALKNGNRQRIQESGDLTSRIVEHSDIVTTFKNIRSNPDFKLRVTHHDTKISNVLFDEDNNGICVIDLDTVMPGYFISDLGDMMRTYLSPVSEEEKDVSRIIIRDDFYRAIVQGYLGEMKDDLTSTEKQYVFYAGKFMIYMQALRFLTDYLNNDRYYGSAYPGHNFVRARNQVTLLEKLVEKEETLSGIH